MPHKYLHYPKAHGQMVLHFQSYYRPNQTPVIDIDINEKLTKLVDKKVVVKHSMMLHDRHLPVHHSTQ